MHSLTPMPLNTLLDTVADNGIAILPNKRDYNAGSPFFFEAKMIAQSKITSKMSIKSLKKHKKISIKTNIKSKNIKHNKKHDYAIMNKKSSLSQSDKSQVQAKIKATRESALEKKDSLSLHFRTNNSIDALPVACIHLLSGNHYA